MTTYYVGIGGSDSNNGTTWALRRATVSNLSGLTLAANDVIYVGPGYYVSTNYVCDTSGSSGSPIKLIGDVTGENTDGIGGPVILCGSSDYGKTFGSNALIELNGHDYREFYGLTFSFCYGGISGTNGETGTVVEDCMFLSGEADNTKDIYMEAMGTTATLDIRRCLFSGGESGIYLYNSASEVATDTTIENCVFLGLEYGIAFNNVNTGTVRHCYFQGCQYGVRTVFTPTANSIDVEYCVLELGGYGLYMGSFSSYGIKDDYNVIGDNVGTAYNNVTFGLNSTRALIPKENAFMIDGFDFKLLDFYQVNRLSPIVDELGADSSVTDDIYGSTRPTATKGMPGAILTPKLYQESTTTHKGSMSVELQDAGHFQIRIPVDKDMRSDGITINVRTYREANYSGTNPQMVIREPGQADNTQTDTGSSATWNTLTRTFTPQSTTHYLAVELRSNNTATSGSYAVYFDTLEVY